MKANVVKVRMVAHDVYWNFKKRFNRLAYLHHLLDHDLDELDIETYEEALAIETRDWVKRGVKVHVSVTDVPSEVPRMQRGAEGNYLQYDTLRKFKKLVEDAEYERSKRKREGRESWIKWITAVAAIIAALGTLLSLYWASHGKKP